MTDTDALLERLRELEKRATPGPWWDEGGGLRAKQPPDGPAPDYNLGLISFRRDAPLIVALRNALPRLLDLVEKGARVEEEIAAMRDRAKVAAYQYADRWKRSWQHVGTEIGSPDNMMAKHKAEAGYTIAQLIEALPLTAPTPDTGKETQP